MEFVKHKKRLLTLKITKHLHIYAVAVVGVDASIENIFKTLFDSANWTVVSLGILIFYNSV